MKHTTRLITLAALTLGVAITPAAFAAGNHDHSPKHGGIVAEGKAFDAELAEVSLEAADHDRGQGLGAADRDPAGEADRVEDLEQGREGIGVPVVRRRAQEEAVVEARREIAHRMRQVAVDREIGRAHV